MSRKCVTIEHCRGCGCHDLTEILAFGKMAVADGLLDSLDDVESERRFPLTLAFCAQCSLVQILENVDPKILFGRDYPYYSSFSPAWLHHNRENALELITSRHLNEQSLVIELACNDGYLLKNFAEAGIPTLGIDPAPGPVAAARELGIDVIEEFFDIEIAERLADERGQCDVLLANNVLAHVPDLAGFASGIERLLKPNGVAVVEFAYICDLIAHCEFDTIYHQHHCYFSATSCARLFRSVGLHVNDVRQLPTHGGSLRIYVGKQDQPTDRIRRLLEKETQLGVTSVKYYQEFAGHVRRMQDALRSLIMELKEEGHSIAAYAASAKGTTLLNAAGIDSTCIDFVVDRNVHKHGRFMPGVHIPICDPARLISKRPDYALLLAWNFKDEILEQQQAYRDAGGKFIVPIPTPQVV